MVLSVCFRLYDHLMDKIVGTATKGPGAGATTWRFEQVAAHMSNAIVPSLIFGMVHVLHCQKSGGGGSTWCMVVCGCGLLIFNNSRSITSVVGIAS